MSGIVDGSTMLQGTSGQTSKSKKASVAKKSNRLKLFISKKNMIFGKRNDPTFCPIALVATKVLGQKVEVTAQNIWTDSGGVIALPLKAREFIKKFDDKTTTIASLRPFSFVIEMGE